MWVQLYYPDLCGFNENVTGALLVLFSKCWQSSVFSIANREQVWRGLNDHSDNYCDHWWIWHFSTLICRFKTYTLFIQNKPLISSSRAMLHTGTSANALEKDVVSTAPGSSIYSTTKCQLSYSHHTSISVQRFLFSLYHNNNFNCVRLMSACHTNIYIHFRHRSDCLIYHYLTQLVFYIKMAA